jgi:hypothetical protein
MHLIQFASAMEKTDQQKPTNALFATES